LFFKRGAGGQAQWLSLIIPATQEAEVKRIMVQGQPRQKLIKTPSQSISSAGMVARACGLSYIGHIGRRTASKAGSGQKTRLYLKNN
jgi:hypothetical protein